VRRVSTGSGVALAAAGSAERATLQFLSEGRYEKIYETAVEYGKLNALFSADH
jgi:hypothetical protein